MKDRVNKIFAILASGHYGVYVILGITLSWLFIISVEPEAQLPIIKKLIYPGIFIIITTGVLMRNFYSKDERGGTQIPISRYGFVIKDDYFFVKITSNIHVFKKISGYSYVIFRAISLSVHGLVLGLAVLMWLSSP